MELVPLTSERKAQLDDYAMRHGQEPAAALDDVLAEALARERRITTGPSSPYWKAMKT